MKIQLKTIKNNQNIVLEELINPEDWDIDIGVMSFPKALSLRAEVWKSGDDLTVQAHVDGEQSFVCSLCLEEFNKLFEKDITLHYDIKGLDVVTIDEDIRQEIISEHPIRILCRADCQGLCRLCGANLNEGLCDCKEIN